MDVLRVLLEDCLESPGDPAMIEPMIKAAIVVDSTPAHDPGMAQATPIRYNVPPLPKGFPP